MSEGHHLIMGELTDFLTGEIVDDTHDERYRQKIAKILAQTKGYDKNQIVSRKELIAKADENRGIIRIDFLVEIDEKFCMIVKYGPGSIVTRHRCVLAMSRLVSGYQIPVVVVTNGEDVDILNGSTGKKTGSGFDDIPGKSALEKIRKTAAFEPIGARRAEMESRILYTYEIDGSCPCDDTVCRL